MVSTTSGTYNYLPDNASLVLQAYSRCGLRRTSFVQEHMVDARNEINLMFSSWANRGVNLWTMDLVTNNLVAGVSTYDVDSANIMVVDAYIESVDSGLDRIIPGVSRSDYAAIPNKATSGVPTLYWFNRQIAPKIVVWPVPDTTGDYVLKYWAIRQIQDANLTNSEIPEIPYRWLDAFVAGLAARLACIYAPERMADLEKKAETAYQIAADQDVEHAPMNFSMAFEGYYR